MSNDQYVSANSASGKVVILGGGITGLSAAFYLQKQAAEQNLNIDITLVEKSERLGGKIHSVQKEGFLIEKGPDSFLARKQPILDLTTDLGLNNQLASTNPQAGSTYIMHKGKLHRMPLGLVLGIPTKITPLIRTGLISPLGKARALLDLVIPAASPKADEALGDFIERRLGKEVLEQMTEPLLAGIYAGDTRALSLGATFPQFRQMEQKHGSLIIGMARNMLRRPAAAKSAPSPEPNQTRPSNTIQQSPSGSSSQHQAVSQSSSTLNETKSALPSKRSMFMSYQGGLSAIVHELERQLQSINIIKGSQAVKIARTAGVTSNHSYQIELDQGQILEADRIICTVPAHAAAQLFQDIPHVSELESIRYVSVANIAFGYKHNQLKQEFEGTGFLVPRKEGRMITACTWSSTKWSHAAPQGHTLLRTYIGRAGAEQWVSMSDEELIEAARRDLRELIGFDAKPDLAEVSRCYESMPQYPVGHQEMMNRIYASMEKWMPGITLCGAGYGGIGIPDCIQHGRESAEQLIQQWQQESQPIESHDQPLLAVK